MKKVLKLGLCMCIMLISVYLIYNHYAYQVLENPDGFKISDNGKNSELINKLRKDYNNNEIIMFLEIPEVFSLPIVQTENNEYYKTHDIYKKENFDGTPFLDYRNKSLNDRKLIINGNNTVSRVLPFSNIINYKDKSYFDKHPNIYMYSDQGMKTYKIFSSFVEKSDFDYQNLTGFVGLEYYEHLLKLKNKSLYDTGVSINDNSKVLILQNQLINQDYNEALSYQVVIAIEVE